MEESRGGMHHQWCSTWGSALVLVALTMTICSRPTVAVDPNMERCSGNADLYDTCPMGMYCNRPIGGTCTNCSYCNKVTLTGMQQLNKCLCDSRGSPDPARVCKAPDPGDEEYPTYQTVEDIEADGLNPAKYYYLINGTKAQYIDCPVTTTPQPTVPTTFHPTPPLTTGAAQSTDLITGGEALTGSSLPASVWAMIVVSSIVVLLILIFIVLFVYKKGCEKRLSGDLESCVWSRRNGTDTVILSDVHVGDINENAASALPAETDRMLDGNGDEAVSSTSDYSTGDKTSQVDGSDSSTRVSSIESTASVHASDWVELCNCTVTEVTWTSLKTKMNRLLADGAFKRAFVGHLFRTSDKADASDVERICAFTPDTDLFLAIQQEMDTFSLDTYSVIGATIESRELRDQFPAKAPLLEELLDSLRTSHKLHRDCKTVSNCGDGPSSTTPV